MADTARMREAVLFFETVPLKGYLKKSDLIICTSIEEMYCLKAIWIFQAAFYLLSKQVLTC